MTDTKKYKFSPFSNNNQGTDLEIAERAVNSARERFSNLCGVDANGKRKKNNRARRDACDDHIVACENFLNTKTHRSSLESLQKRGLVNIPVGSNHAYVILQ